jgi:uncharacterized protein
MPSSVRVAAPPGRRQPPGVPSKFRSPSTPPISDDEFRQLAEFLDAQCTFDPDGVLGFMNAVAVAPTLLPPSVWLPILLPKGLEQLDAKRGQFLISLLFRLYNEVLDALQQHNPMMPEAEDVEACESFADGYASAAELDPEWIGNDDRWTFAAPLAYLAGRLDLVPPDMLEKIERDLASDPKQVVRRDMGGLVLAADESFEKYRRPPSADERQAARIGRNDPCPCGSGRKYKRCCIDREDEIGTT